MRPTLCVLAVAMLGFALGACGESSEEQAQSTVCDARAKAFTTSVQGIASEVLSSLSAADAKTALVTALEQLKTSYQTAFEPLDCD